MMSKDFDVLIVGAGLAGIGAAVMLQKRCPGRSYQILEARQASGGTWDVFRYPGVRSDSDMQTLGYGFRPWKGDKAIADGPSILSYLRETAAEHGIEDKIRYGCKVVSADWQSDQALWRVTIEKNGELQHVTCGWLHVCAGYFRQDAGYLPDFPGQAQFRGDVIHPQNWPERYDYSGKRVAVIGSGATAVTLVPAMTDKAAHVTMVQRSPSYVAKRPSQDGLARLAGKVLPSSAAFQIARWRNILLQVGFYGLARRFPKLVKGQLIKRVDKALGTDFDAAKHFTPRYNPWDERLCVVPDGDLFEAIKAGKASIETGHIERFAPEGLVMASGKVVEADLIVAATGLELQFLGDIKLSLDGVAKKASRQFIYKNTMLSGIPNMTLVVGYTNASWTLRVDLANAYLCRMLKMMARDNLIEAKPVADQVKRGSYFLNLTSGYVLRAKAKFPRSGAKAPWQLSQSYLSDIFSMRLARLKDGVLAFRKH